MSESRDYVTLGELADLNSESLGAKTPTDHMFKYIDLTSVSHGSIDMAALEQFRFIDAPSRARRVVRDGDVLFGTVRPRLRSHARVAGHGYVASTGFCVTRARPGVADGGFLGHFLLSDEVTRQAIRREVGSNYPAVTERDVAAFRLPRIPLEEQRRIAEILDTLDETIRATERLIAKLMDVEQGLRRDLLDRKFKCSRPEDWKHCRIGDFADVQRGASPRPIDNLAWFAPDGPGWIRISDVTAAGDLLLRTRDHLSPAGVARSRRTFPGDVIMSIAATIGVAIVVGIEACYHDGFVRIDHDGSVIPEFLVMLLAHHKEDFVRSGQTGTQANINSTIVAATEVALPSLEVQLEIVSATSAVRGSIRVEQESRGALQETRAGLAADLLSGRVRTVAA